MLGRGRPALSLSLRLVITYGLLIASTLMIVGGLVVYLTRSHLASRLDSDIVSAVESFEQGPGAGVERSSDLIPATRSWLAVRAFPPDQFAAVRTSDGRVLSSAGGLDIDSLDRGRTLLLSTSSRWDRVRGPGGDVRVLSVPLDLDGDQAGTLVVGASEADVDRTVSALVGGIGWAALTGLLFAAVLGFVVVRRTLRPLAQISSEAQAIEETGDLSRRVAYAGPLDEVGRLAAIFDEMLARLQESFESQRRFLADASHELRTPLTVVRGQLELLQRETHSGEGQRSLRVGLEEVDRMGRIVEDLLLLARLDEGIPLKREPVEIELVLQEALLRAMLIAPREASVDVEDGIFVLADADRLLQVVTNLVSNAIHHAGPAATLRLAARRDGGRVRIEVSDSGTGIPPEDIPHVFERLYRGSSPKTDAPGGAGLGLAIASSLTEAMGGTLTVSSTVGVGTTFTILMPEATDVETWSRPEVVTEETTR